MKEEKSKKNQLNKLRKRSFPIEAQLGIPFVICLAVFLSVLLPLYFCLNITFHWIIFGALAIIVLFGGAYFPTACEKYFHTTDEQKKNIKQYAGKTIFLLWFYDIVYMTCFNGWIAPMFILGVIAILIDLISLTKFFMNNENNFHFVMGLELILAVGFSVYLIYSIPNDNLREIVTTIVAAMYGGLLTLAGVAWTIKKGDEQRRADREQLEQDRKEEERKKKEEERKKYIPYIKITSENATSEAKAYTSNDLDYSQNEKELFYEFILKDFSVKNVSIAPLLLLGVFINEKYYNFETPILCEKESVCCVKTTENWGYCSWNTLSRFSILVQDILGNKYTIDTNFVDELNGLPAKLIDKKEYTIFNYDYTIVNCALPRLMAKEKNNEQYNDDQQN